MSDEPVRIEITEQRTPSASAPDRPKLESPIAISIVEQYRQDDIRARSIDLAIQRGHLRNG